MFQMIEGKAVPLGVTETPEGVQFAVAFPGAEKCSLNLYRKGSRKKEMSFLMSGKNQHKVGDVFSCILVGEDLSRVLSDDFEYMYEVDGKEFPDVYAKELNGRSKWGKNLSEEEKREVRCGFVLESYDWKGDKRLSLSFSDMILYQLHVRGFTKHYSSKVLHKGTFLGVTEKIPYFKELGINSVLLLPCYEFNEIMPIGSNLPDYAKVLGFRDNDAYLRRPPDYKINFWGYTKDSFYFAPKASYAYDCMHPGVEFKNMVKELHQNGIEVLMEICFASGTNSGMILDCLRNWVLDFHVDGFHINQDVVSESLVRTDPILSETKLLGTHWDKESHEIKERRGSQRNKFYKRLADFNDGFLIDARRYLKGDEGQVSAYASRMRNNPKEIGVINYLTRVNGFTLMDLVSYDVKYNQANGEENRDGSEYNYSWNCGVEGKSRKKNILERRSKQIKNAMLLLLLSQGTPMLLAGDEFGNSQNGNNNAYCQDNEIGWVNWNTTELGKEIFRFSKDLIAFRKRHPIFHMEEGLLGMDTISCGFPDISFHGTKAWYTDFSNYSRLLGILLCGKYARVGNNKFDNFYYIIYNMHWDAHDFDLPKLPEGLTWNIRLSSGKTEAIKKEKVLHVEQRTIVVLESIVRSVQS